MKVNIGIAGGMCTGKSTLAARLFSSLKDQGLDYDLISEESRKLKKEFGNYRSPFERFYMWRQQEREELRSSAENGFITDAPLFNLYCSARMYSQEARDDLAVRELFRMCLEIKDRYQLIVIAKNPLEIPYKKDGCRNSDREKANQKHHIIKTFVQHFWNEKLLEVSGKPDQRVRQIEKRLKEIGLNF